jgi:hypothetical protein
VSKEFLLLVTILQTLSCLVAAGIYLILDAKGRKEFAIFGALLIASALADISQYVFFFWLGLSANVVATVYQLIEIILLCLWYRKQLAGSLNPLVFNIALTLLLAFGLVNMFGIQGWNNINSYTRIPHGIVMIVFSLVYFYTLLKGLPTRSVQRLPMFWINIGVLFYYSGTFFVMIFTDYLVNVLKNDLIYQWAFHNFLGIVHNILFAFALWLHRQNPK